MGRQPDTKYMQRNSNLIITTQSPTTLNTHTQTHKTLPHTIYSLFPSNSYIDPEAFLDTPHLTHLYLDGNRLNQLGSPEVGWIQLVRPLTTLSMAESEVMTFEPGWVRGEAGGDGSGVSDEA